jgi:acetyl-CoA carboxylase biotin carboxyl carrier protein
MAIERDDLKEIVAAVATAGIEEFSLEIGDLKIRLTRHAVGAPPSPSSGTEASDPAAAARSASRPARPPAAAASRPSAERAEEGLVSVTAPLLGTFYRAPDPDAPPFVEVGSVVEPDDTVCIIEVMKLMNNVRAGCRGRVARVCAENATLVEFGQTLILIEPLP